MIGIQKKMICLQEGAERLEIDFERLFGEVFNNFVTGSKAYK